MWNRTADAFGRKINGYLIGSTQVIGWILTIYASTPVHLIVARFILGTGGCGAIINSQLYINETAYTERKGPLSSLILLSMNAGFFIVFLLGYFLPYDALNVSCLLISIAFFVFFVWLPESPLYLLTKKDLIGAKKSMLWFRSDEAEAEAEISDFQRLLMHPDCKKASYRELVSAKYIKRTTIAVTLLIAQQLSGIGIILAYTEEIFKLSQTPIPSNLSMLIIGCTQCATSLVSGIFINHVGRKVLLLASYVGAFFSFMILYAFMMTKTEHDSLVFNFLPTFGMFCFILSFNIGIGPVPFVMYPEMFAANILNHASCVCSLGLMLSAFCCTKIFPYLVGTLGTAGVFLVFALANLFLALFVLRFVSETKTVPSRQQTQIEKNVSIN